MRTVFIVLGVLLVLWLLKRIGALFFNAFMSALVLRTRTCTLSCHRPGTATYLLCDPDKSDDAGIPVCEECLRKRKGPSIEWLISRGYLRLLAKQEST